MNKYTNAYTPSACLSFPSLSYQDSIIHRHTNPRNNVPQHLPVSPLPQKSSIPVKKTPHKAPSVLLISSPPSKLQQPKPLHNRLSRLTAMLTFYNLARICEHIGEEEMQVLGGDVVPRHMWPTRQIE